VSLAELFHCETSQATHLQTRVPTLATSNNKSSITVLEMLLTTITDKLMAF